MKGSTRKGGSGILPQQVQIPMKLKVGDMVIVPNTGIQLKLDGEKVNLYEGKYNENQRIMNRYVLLGLFWFLVGHINVLSTKWTIQVEWFKEYFSTGIIWYTNIILYIWELNTQE